MLNHLGGVDTAAWNRLVENNHPFLKHQFLLALEQQGCVGETMGGCRAISLSTEQKKRAANPIGKEAQTPLECKNRIA